MSEAFRASEIIDRPVEDVWIALTDWTNAHRWMPGVESLLAEGDIAVGTKLTFRARGKDRPSQIVKLESGTSLTLQSVQGGVTADYTYSLRSRGDEATDATLVAECETEGILWTALSPVIRFAVRRTDSRQLEALKAMIERN